MGVDCLVNFPPPSTFPVVQFTELRKNSVYATTYIACNTAVMGEILHCTKLHCTALH